VLSGRFSLMSTYSARTSHRSTVGLQVRPRESRNVYLPYASESPQKEEFTPPTVPYSAAAPPRRSRFQGLANAYDAAGWILGFKEKSSFVSLFIFGGALIGYCLARTMMLDPAKVPTLLVPGEWFWLRRRMYNICIFMHIYSAIISGIFAVFQFIPAIRRRSMILHRINGYLVLVFLIPSTISGAIVGRRAFGGDLNVQTTLYVATLLIIFSAGMGIFNVRRTRKHRRWMLRMVVLDAMPITAHLIGLAIRTIAIDLGNYYAVWRCDQLLFVMTNVTAVEQLYPQCTKAGVDLTEVFVAVHASVKGGRLGSASITRATFGMCMWLALVIHIIGVEIYIRKTESSNRHRHGFALERSGDDDDDAAKSKPATDR